jgi:hypothetical protein
MEVSTGMIFVQIFTKDVQKGAEVTLTPESLQGRVIRMYIRKISYENKYTREHGIKDFNIHVLCKKISQRDPY